MKKIKEFDIKATEESVLLFLSDCMCPTSSATLFLFILSFFTLFVLLPFILSAFLPQPPSLPPSLPAALTACLSLARAASVLSS